MQDDQQFKSRFAGHLFVEKMGLYILTMSIGLGAGNLHCKYLWEFAAICHTKSAQKYV